MTRRNFIIYFIWMYWLEYRISWNSFKYVEILSGSDVSESLPMLASCRLVMAFSVCSSAFLGVYLWVPAKFGSKNLENQLENCQKSFSQKISEKSNMKKFWKVWEKKSREMSDSQTFVSGESCFEDDHDRPTRGNCQSIYRRTLYHLKAKASLVIFPEAFEVNENNNNFNKVRFESTYFFCMSWKQRISW